MGQPHTTRKPPGIRFVAYAFCYSNIKSKKKLSEIKAARRYETIFVNDTDGIITVEELSDQLQKPSFKSLKNLSYYSERDFSRTVAFSKVALLA